MLVVITRPYGGQEGRRVKKGTMFSVNEDVAGVIRLEQGRWLQLRNAGLAREVGQDDTAAAPGAKPAPQPQAKPARVRRTRVEPDSKPPPGPPAAITNAAFSRLGARLRTPGKGPAVRQEATPEAPRPLARQNGGPAGPEASSSSSPAGQASGTSTSRPRGERRAKTSTGSSSTTPTSSPPGPTPSTPATDGGGASTAGAPDSAAFD